MKAGLVVCACIAAAAALAAIVAFSNDSGNSDAADESGSGRPPRAQVRGCGQRVEGIARITPRRRRDTVIGPLALIALPITYRDFSSRPIGELEPDPRIGMTLMKAIAWLRASAASSR